MSAAPRSVDANEAMFERYSRAAQLAGPRFAARHPAGTVEGYWLDNRHFFFLSEKLEASLGRVASVPSLADAEAGRVEELLSLQKLAELLSNQGYREIGLEALSSATFDVPDPRTLAVSVAGIDFHIDVRRQTVLSAKASLRAPALYSPDGRWACFVRNHDLWLKERQSGAERRLTTDGREHEGYGQQPESCLAAVSYRRHPTPMGLWSPDSQWFLTHRIDERAVPELPLVQNVPPDGGRPVLHRYRYPLQGDPLATAVYVAVHIPSGRVVMFQEFLVPVLTFSPFAFFCRMAWFGEEGTAWCIRQDRYSRRTELIELDLARGAGRVVIDETATSGYLELHHLLGAKPNVRTLRDSREIVWFSERSGWGHLYLHDALTGALKNAVTSGEWMVRDLIHVDERRRRVLFTACGIDPKADPARRTLCTVGLDGAEFEILHSFDGDVSLPRSEPWGLAQDRPFAPSYAQPGVSPDMRYGTILRANVIQGNETIIVDLANRRSFVIASSNVAFGAVPPRPITALAADGLTRLHGVLFLPSDFDEGRRYPLIDYIYPGPQVTQQPQSLDSSGASFARALAELGFVTLMLDTRGTPFRSRAFHQAGYGGLLEPQLADHAATVCQLCEQYSFLDGERIGIVGLSSGGFAAARALLDYGAIFKVGVSVCGNHDSRLYASSWADKYRGPVADETAAAQANDAVAHKLCGKLLLISGDTDENVHVSHTLRLVDALIRANRDFDCLIVPNAGHMVLMENGYVLRRVWDYLVRHLLDESPPAFELSFTAAELAVMEKTELRGVW